VTEVAGVERAWVVWPHRPKKGVDRVLQVAWTEPSTGKVGIQKVVARPGSFDVGHAAIASGGGEVGIAWIELAGSTGHLYFGSGKDPESAAAHAVELAVLEDPTELDLDRLGSSFALRWQEQVAAERPSRASRVRCP
jgi:hypothetical protein